MYLIGFSTIRPSPYGIGDIRYITLGLQLLNQLFNMVILLYLLIYSSRYGIIFPTWREKRGSDISIANMVIIGNYSMDMVGIY